MKGCKPQKALQISDLVFEIIQLEIEGLGLKLDER
jgi:hypothetical protein